MKAARASMKEEGAMSRAGRLFCPHVGEISPSSVTITQRTIASDGGILYSPHSPAATVSCRRDVFPYHVPHW